MKVKHIHNSLLAKIIGMNITLYPFIFYVGIPDKRVLNHERVHIKQIESVGFFKFYLTYFWQYLQNRFSGMDHNKAYLNIPYEVEAYAKENDPV